jgi:hypothetical protein
MHIPPKQLSPFGGHTELARTGSEHRKRGARETASVSGHDGPGTALNDRVISLVEAAAISGLSPDTLKRCNRRGELEILRLSPRRIGVRLSHLWAFIDARVA